MKIIDISWPISAVMTEYKNKPVMCMDHIKTFGKDGARESIFRFSTHTGTHVDAPSHFLRDGLTIDQIDLNRCFGPCVVVDCTNVEEAVTAEDLENVEIEKDDIVLLKTTNSALEATASFDPYFVYLHVSGALYLAEKGIKAVGIDYLGIEHSQEGHLTHHELFKHDVVIIEGLRLGHVETGHYMFSCFPLNLVGAESAPARAVLFES